MSNCMRCMQASSGGGADGVPAKLPRGAAVHRRRLEIPCPSGLATEVGQLPCIFSCTALTIQPLPRPRQHDERPSSACMHGCMQLQGTWEFACMAACSCRVHGSLHAWLHADAGYMGACMHGRMQLQGTCVSLAMTRMHRLFVGRCQDLETEIFLHILQATRTPVAGLAEDTRAAAVNAATRTTATAGPPSGVLYHLATHHCSLSLCLDAASDRPEQEATFEIAPKGNRQPKNVFGRQCWRNCKMPSGACNCT